MRTTCRISGEPLEQVIDLGSMFISNFVKTREEDLPAAPLRIGIGRDSGLLQLIDPVERPSLYKHYWYRSGTNATMRRQLGDVVDATRPWVKLDDGDVVLDIGCNDGTLLSQYPQELGVLKVGIDPAENMAPLARSYADRHAISFFNAGVFNELAGGRKAKVITSIAMFYGLEDPHPFVADIASSLHDEGVWVLQLSYTPLMIFQNAFDNICHEHVEYYTLHSLQYLLRMHGLEVVDVTFNDTNGGSFRVTSAKKGAKLSHVPLFLRDLGRYRIAAALDYEHAKGFNRPDVYKEFMRRVARLKEETRQLLADIRAKGQTVCGYGASTKGNTLLQYYGIGPESIVSIAERQPQKYGLMTVGSWIPIESEEAVRARKPDYMVVLPWHFIQEFRERERPYLAAGGKLIIPLPELVVIDKP